MTPDDFDVEKWLDDAHLPEESVDVFKRGDVVATLSKIERRIEAERQANQGERTVSDGARLAELEKQHQELVDVFGESMLTIYVRALSPTEQTAIVDALPAGATKGELAFQRLLASIVAVEAHGGERQPVRMTAERLRAMEERIGAVQVRQLVFAQQQVQESLPVVDADFLHRPSGDSDDSPE